MSNNLRYYVNPKDNRRTLFMSNHRATFLFPICFLALSLEQYRYIRTSITLFFFFY